MRVPVISIGDEELQSETKYFVGNVSFSFKGTRYDLIYTRITNYDANNGFQDEDVECEQPDDIDDDSWYDIYEEIKNKIR